MTITLNNTVTEIDTTTLNGDSLADEILLSVAKETKVATVKNGTVTRDTRGAALPAARVRAWSFGGRVD